MIVGMTVAAQPCRIARHGGSMHHHSPLLSTECWIVKCSGVTPWFAFVVIRREEDLLDLAPFLADNSRLGERD